MNETIAKTEPTAATLPPPPALLSRNPARWLTIFGPGAIIASLTIGAGELIFSSRAGALFGLNILCLFLLVLACKWVLLFTIARQMVLGGTHQFESWAALPGPRAWLPITLAILAIICFPVWVFFHAGTLGTFVAWLTSTTGTLNGTGHFLWGAALLALVTFISLKGGYSALERIQLLITILMLGAVMIALVMINPDWLGILKGLFLPQSFIYPDWVKSYPEIAARPPWLEAITYVGVLGGSSYDYLAYTSYLRDKRWGAAGNVPPSAPPPDLDSRWLRAPFVDCTLSFVVVLVFTMVFVVCGHQLLGPEHKVPAGNNLLDLQAAFLTPLYPGLKYLYFAGAFLTIFGTLYGTIEVAPAIGREISRALLSRNPNLRRISILWVTLGAFLILLWSIFQTWAGAPPPNLVAILTPANLFTGVLGCGIICLLAPWSHSRSLPQKWRMPRALLVANLLTGLLFLALGLFGYWQHSRWISLLILLATLAAGCLAAFIFQSKTASAKPA